MKTKSALSWFGSDSEVAADLASMLNHCSHVTIPFCGGMAILPHLNLARAIVANDKHAEAINFYRVMSGMYSENGKAELIRRCCKTLSHPNELCFEDSMRGMPHPAQRAWAFWAKCWVGRKGKGGTKHVGGMPSVRWTATGGTNASRIRAAAGDLVAWSAQFQRCEWICLDFRDVLGKVNDKPGCGIYVDAPWVGAGKDYLHSFDEQDHRDLAGMLQRFEHATVVVRYGADELISELYPESEWRWLASASRTQANKVRGEVWITRNVRS